MFAPFSFLGCVRCPLCSALLFHCVSSIELKNLETQVWQMLYFSQHLPWDLSLVPEFFPLSHALVVIIITSFVLGFFCVVTVDSNNRTKRTIQNYMRDRELFQTAQSLHSFVQGCRQSAQDWLSLKLWAWMVMVTRRPLTAQNDLLLSKGGLLCANGSKGPGDLPRRLVFLLTHSTSFSLHIRNVLIFFTDVTVWDLFTPAHHCCLLCSYW